MRILNEQYPAPKPSINALIISLVFGLFVASFLIFFEPFDLNIADYENKNFRIFVFGIITSFVLIFFLILLPSLFTKIFSDNIWNVKHQIIFYLIILLVIATLNGLYINYLEEFSFKWSNYWWIIKRTFALGIIPIGFIVLIDYNRRLKIFMKHEKNLNMDKVNDIETIKNEVFQIRTSSKDEVFFIDLNKFLFAEAQGNYVFIIEQAGKEPSKTLYRISISHIAEQLNSCHLKRCHRSFIANFLKVEYIKGNAQGLKLYFSNGSFKIPVSRTYLPLVRKYFPKKNRILP